jgi:hypothetical protein
MRVKSFCKLFWGLSLALFIQGCSSTSNIPKPNEGYESFEYKPTSSVVNVPISLSEKMLNSKINAEINGLLFEDKNMEDDNVMLKVWKVQPIAVQLNGMSIDYRIPLKIWLKGGMTKLGITVAKEVELQIALKYHTTFGIAPDWSVSSKTVSTGFEWITNPEVSLVGFKIPVKYVADKIVAGMQGKVCSEIDNQIKTQFDIKAQMATAWKQVQQPMLINKDYNIWLKLIPSEITATPFTSRNRIISTAVGVKSQTEVLVSSKAPVVTPVAKLPNFRLIQKSDGQFNFNIWTDIPYAEAEQMAIKEVKGKMFNSGSKAVTVNGLQIYGSNGKVVVGANLSGSFNGTIYFVGVPVYNKEKQAVEVTDLDFEMQTRNILFKSAAWLFKSTIKEKIKENMVFPISSYLNTAKNTANASLKNNHSIQNIAINGVVDQIDIDNIYLADKSFKILGIAKGKLNVAVEGLSF